MSELPPTLVYAVCASCGELVATGSAACSACGAELASRDEEPGPARPVSRAGLLGALVHRVAERLPEPPGL